MADKRELSGRVWLLDELRGLFILLMVLYHLFYDLDAIFGVPLLALHWWPMQWAQLLIAGLFVFISGVACRYSRSNVRRGVQCFFLGMMMTAITLLFLPSQAVIFGVLHFLGVSMLLFALLRPLLDRIPPVLGLLLCAALFFLTCNAQRGYLGMRGWEIWLPASWYETPFLFWLGFPGPTFWSSDYFPLLPWLFWFLGGTFVGVFAHAGRLPAWAYRPHSRFFAWLGRHTLVIYLLHQPVVYGLLWLIFR